MDGAELRRIEDRVKTARVRASGRPLVGVFAHGGLGDLLRANAFCRHAARDGSVVLLFNDVGDDSDGRPLAASALAGVEQFCALATVPLGPPAMVSAECAELFDVYHELQTACVRSWYWHDAERQRRADLRLQPFRGIADLWPQSAQMLSGLRVSLWRVMQMTSGFCVLPEDMAVAEGQAPDWLGQDGGPRTVALSTGVGGGKAGVEAVTKQPPVAAFAEIARELGAAGVQCVQVGCVGEPTVPECIDLRGLTLPATAAVLRRCVVYVGPEGGLVYVAKAVGTRSAVLFASTPVSVFAMPGNLAWTREACPACWWHAATWGTACRAGCVSCRNVADGAEVGRALAALVAHEASKGGA